MNRIINRLTTLLNRNKRTPKRGRRTRRGGGNRRYNFAGLAYNENPRPQRYGPGTTTRNIEQYFEAFNHSYFNLQSLLSGNTEHLTMCTLYNYMKVINIAISIYPAQAQIATGYINIQLNWNNQDDTNIPKEDNVKIVPIFRTRKYFYKFVPLNMPLILGTTESPVVLNMINYMRTSDNIVIPGCFNFDSEEAFTARVKVSMRIEYRGSKVPDSTGLTQLADKVRKTEPPRPNIKRVEIKIGKMQDNSELQEAQQEDDSDSGESCFLSEEEH